MGSPCKYILHVFSIVILFCAESVVLPKKLVVQNGTTPDSDVVVSVYVQGATFKILPDVVDGADEKLDPMVSFLLIFALFVIIIFDVVICVFCIDDTVALVAITFVKLLFVPTNKVPVLRLLLLTVPKIEIPEICKLDDDILVDLTFVDNKLVVVWVVLFTNGTIKFVLTDILLVLMLSLLNVPKRDIFVTVKFPMVDVFTIWLFKNAVFAECKLPVLKFILATVARVVVLFT